VKRSLFLQLFLIFYVVLFVALSIITASFIYSRQRMENEAAELEMLERARALAATSQDYYAARMTLGAYQTVLEHAVDEKTAIWIVNPFGIVLQVSGLPEGEELLTQQQLVASWKTCSRDRNCARRIWPCKAARGCAIMWLRCRWRQRAAIRLRALFLFTGAWRIFPWTCWAFTRCSWR
jgi:hypothetical protein